MVLTVVVALVANWRALNHEGPEFKTSGLFRLFFPIKTNLSPISAEYLFVFWNVQEIAF